MKYLFILLALLFPSTLFAAASYDLLAPILGTTTLTSLKDYLLLVFRAAIGLAGVLAVVMIVVCGIKLMGNPSVSGKSEAKECIWNAIFGVILILGSWLLLNTINPLLLNNDIALVGIASAPTVTTTATTEPDPTAPGCYFKYKDNNSGNVKFSRSNTCVMCEEIRAKDLADTVNYTVLSNCYQIVAGSPPPSIPPSTPLGNTLLSVLKGGMGAGTVTGTGINCGTDCSETYSGSPTITLSAAPEAGSTFTSWFGGGCSGTETCEVSMIKNREVKATFASNFGNIGGSPPSSTPPPASPPPPTGVTLIISKPSGTETYGAITTSLINGNIYTIHNLISSQGITGITTGTIVTLTATGYPGYSFTSWSGDCASAGTNPVCVITMSANKSVVASFAVAVAGNISYSWVNTPNACGPGAICFDLAFNSSGITPAQYQLSTIESSGTVNVLFPWAPGLTGGWGGALPSNVEKARLEVIDSLGNTHTLLIPFWPTWVSGGGSSGGGGAIFSITPNPLKHEPVVAGPVICGTNPVQGCFTLIINGATPGGSALVTTTSHGVYNLGTVNASGDASGAWYWPGGCGNQSNFSPPPTVTYPFLIDNFVATIDGATIGSVPFTCAAP